MNKFDFCNIYDAVPQYTTAHEGEGLVLFARIVDKGAIDGPCNFIDFSVVPPGVSIGDHTHALDEEEYYLILKGDGELLRDGQRVTVRSGDLIRNRPGGTHSLRNIGTEDLHLFVFELSLA